MALRRPPEARFLNFVIVDDGNNGCWPWGGSIDRRGYGAFCPGGRQTICKAHRWSYEHFVGPIPHGLQLDHLCRRRDCVNPVHLEPVTQAENIRRGASARGRALACKQGHEFTPENTYMCGDKRHCRACHRRRQSEWKRRRQVLSPSGSAE